MLKIMLTLTTQSGSHTLIVHKLINDLIVDGNIAYCHGRILYNGHSNFYGSQSKWSFPLDLTCS